MTRAVETVIVAASAPSVIEAVETADIAITDAIAPHRDLGLVKVLGLIGKAGDQPPLAILSGAVLLAGLIRRQPSVARAGVRMLAAHGLATAAKNVIKTHVDRSRPFLQVEEGRYERGPGQRRDKRYSSFPSGHTAGAVAVAEAVRRELPDLTVPARVAAAVIAVAQVPKCAHYPSDVGAGAVVGVLSEALVNALVRVAFESGEPARR